MKGQKSKVSLEVYQPAGTPEAIQRHAPRLTNLKGKTICELSDRVWEDFRTFPEIRKQLQKRFPDMKIIPYTEFPGTYLVSAETLSKIVKDKGCDGAIVGNAA
ncbi:MAG: hypothetical protein V1767_04860 [Chloroflexota bacterium]